MPEKQTNKEVRSEDISYISPEKVILTFRDGC